MNERPASEQVTIAVTFHTTNITFRITAPDDIVQFPQQETYAWYIRHLRESVAGARPTPTPPKF
jgi:hypothetical protein